MKLCNSYLCTLESHIGDRTGMCSASHTCQNVTNTFQSFNVPKIYYPTPNSCSYFFDKDEITPVVKFYKAHHQFPPNFKPGTERCGKFRLIQEKNSSVPSGTIQKPFKDGVFLIGKHSTAIIPKLSPTERMERVMKSLSDCHKVAYLPPNQYLM